LDALERTRPGDTAARYDALVELGKAHFQADEVAEADDALLAAISAAESLGDPARMATAAALLNHASVWPTRDHGEVSAAVIDALERTLAALPTDDAPERARMLGCLASELI